MTKAPEQLTITGPTVYLEHAVLPAGTITIDHEHVSDIQPKKIKVKKPHITLPETWHLIPGMIDVHMHGAAGADFMDATPKALATISKALPQEGITSFVPATMTVEPPGIETALRNANTYCSQAHTTGAEILGINLEGPFVAPIKAGAHNAEYSQEPNIKAIKRWQELAPDLIKLVTIAPELPGSQKVIEYLTKNNIVASIGHSNATYAEAEAAIAAGAKHATHLFNAMHAIHHREPGIAIAALLNPQIVVEVIADGVHLHPAMLQLVMKLKGPTGIVLVTDSVRAKHLGDGSYNLGGQKVIVKKGVARLEDGTLAGCTLSMDQALRNIIKFTDCSLADAVHMATTNPAKQIGVFDTKGSIAVGKDADLVVLDEKLHVRMTIVKGKIVFNSP